MSSSVRQKINEVVKSVKRARYAPEPVAVVEPKPIIKQEVVDEAPKPVKESPAIEKPQFKKVGKTKRKVSKKV
tara:strand:- start:2030 stop:2248 length:219 start_codon:yes stop_codon:yes gene_type:complete